MEDLHERWPHRWITPKVKVIDSDIHGTGVEAIEDIGEGENIVVFGGVVIPVAEIREYWQKIGHVGIQISDDFFIVPSTKGEIAAGGVFNHSCSPNCGFSNSITLVALRDIKVGEELVFDYAFCETVNDGFECRCGSGNCRKVIRKTDWKVMHIQEKFGKYFSPYLKVKFLA